MKRNSTAKTKTEMFRLGLRHQHFIAVAVGFVTVAAMEA